MGVSVVGGWATTMESLICPAPTGCTSAPGRAGGSARPSTGAPDVRLRLPSAVQIRARSAPPGNRRDLSLYECSDFDGGSHPYGGDLPGDRGGGVDVARLDDVVAAEWFAGWEGAGAVCDLAVVEADGDGSR